jgi:hypothetical protein
VPPLNWALTEPTGKENEPVTTCLSLRFLEPSACPAVFSP